MQHFSLLMLLCFSLKAEVPAPEFSSVEAETLRHYQAILRMDSSRDERAVAAYLKEALEAEGIAVRIFARDERHPNVVARLKGSGKLKPVLIMAHTDVVGVQPEKWSHPAFAAERADGYVYGRGTIDDKDNVTAGLMTMLLLKRLHVPLDRDVIFLAEAGEEGSPEYGTAYMAEQHWDEIAAEFAIAEGGNVFRRGGTMSRTLVRTTEKIPYTLRLVAKGPSGHGSRPLADNSVAHLASAVAKVSAWRTPMRLNDATRAYFERLSMIAEPAAAARYKGLVDSARAGEIEEYLRLNEPMHYSMLRTSISPTMLKAGFRMNVIPSEAEATLDVRALPDEKMPEFLAEMRKVIGDPAVEIVPVTSESPRPASPPSSRANSMFAAIEAAQRKVYPGAPVIPTMSTGATDNAYLQARGTACYGIGPLLDEEDAPRGFGAHSDQERLLEAELHRFVRFNWDIITAVAASH